MESKDAASFGFSGEGVTHWPRLGLTGRRPQKSGWRRLSAVHPPPVDPGGAFSLELDGPRSHCRRMKCMMLWVVLLATPLLWAQDAATEQRLNRLNGQVEDLLASHADLQKRLASLSRELDALREQNKATGLPATQEDIKRLFDAIKEVDRKRLEDYEKIRVEIQKLGQAFSAPPLPPRKATPVRDTGGAGAATLPEKGFEYVIQPGDTLSVIVQAYREKGIRVTVDQVVKANPGLKPNALRVGQKVFIPAPDK